MGNKPNLSVPQKPTVNVRLDQLEQLVCSDCGHDKFVQLVEVRTLPALLAPNSQEGIAVTAAGIACSECGAENKAKPKSTLVLGGGNDGATTKDAG